ncbi:CHAT domain-containing tetratricopeptide repeat protein [Hymenobacter nivis]|uniref:CHAT domain-containing protein n=1 Tax=Hymenobacter nivis TaxID=1850093 RepID=A0A502G9Y4_9BACT|nr:CHAT domain-containing protein [Hymenobacter nivis]TPG58461.1 CHAT domain-containing protein [Hymenobacter nivis]
MIKSELQILLQQIDEIEGDACIQLIRRALIIMQETRDIDWAFLQLKLGVSLKKSFTGNNAQNIDNAIKAFYLALQIYTREKHAYHWAITHGNLGNAYLDKLTGDTAQNIEKAIQLHEQASEIFTKEIYPEEWANTQYNLGNAYYKRAKDKNLSMENAIQAYRNALQVFTIEHFPFKRGYILNNLGLAYLDRLEGNSDENQDLAIYVFEEASQIDDYKNNTQEWVKVQVNLADTYAKRINGVPAENSECAVNAYKHALEVYALPGYSKELADTQQKLGTVYQFQPHGERSKNLEDALEIYNSALQFFTKETYPEEWADISINLNGVYIHRLRGDWKQNLEIALEISKSILEIFNKENNIKIWGDAQLGLGTTYAKRLLGDRPENLKHALEAYNLASQAYEQDKNIEQWAGVQINIGNIYLEPLIKSRFQNVEVQNIENGINAYTLALQVFTQANYPEQWAIIQINLGAAYRWRLQGNRPENIEKSINAYKSALQVYTKIHHTRLHLDTSYYLADLLYKEKQWPEAREVYENAHQALVLLRGDTYHQESRKYLSYENAELYANLIHCCLLLNDHAAAATYALSSKSRTLTELMAESSSSLDILLAQDPLLRAAWAPIQELKKRLDFLLNSFNLFDSFTSNTRQWQKRQADHIDTEIASLQRDINQLSDTMIFRFPALAGIRPLPQLSINQIQELLVELNSIPLVEYIQHGGGWCAFIFTPAEVYYVQLAGNLSELLFDSLFAIIADTFWVRDGQLIDQSTALKSMYSLLIAPLKAHTSIVGPLVLAPTGPLHLVPFQALADEQGHYLSEDCALSFIPSAATMYILHKQIRELNIKRNGVIKQRLLSVAYSDSNGNYLPHVLSEAKAISKHFTELVELLEEEALPERVIQKASQPFEVIHIGCHGSFNYDSLLDSGLLLAQQRLLTINDIRLHIRLQGRPLVTLSACQTGHTRPERADETNGLSWAFLAAGASAVVSSQWSVADEATRELFEAFYFSRRQADISDAEALRQAIQHLRQNPVYQEHPFFWAAFQVMGIPLPA